MVWVLGVRRVFEILKRILGVHCFGLLGARFFGGLGVWG